MQSMTTIHSSSILTISITYRPSCKVQEGSSQCCVLLDFGEEPRWALVKKFMSNLFPIPSLNESGTLQFWNYPGFDEDSWGSNLCTRQKYYIICKCHFPPFFCQSNRYQQMSSGLEFQGLNFTLSNALPLEHLSYLGASSWNKQQFSA